MNTIRKMMLFLLLLAMIFASTACSSDSESKRKRRTNSSRSDSKNDPFSFMDADLFDTTPHVPEDLYQYYIQWYKDCYSDSPVEIDFDYDVTHIPNESLHQETVQVDYHIKSACGYENYSDSYTYQYYASDDIWEKIDSTTVVGTTFELNADTFPTHWERSHYDFDYTIDILNIDEKAQTITISYAMDGPYYNNYHINGTQTIPYSQPQSFYYEAKLVDEHSYTIRLFIDGLECL